ncbi:hypothetical protein [Desulfovibrio inopinatus]|uniref:hypothetical protein n=1 Tax=Desulfovibrio inopinatus TaxID=102109 RepID=UPI00040E70EC|nr:hypothetical protein [Desulfovibrio inopinatus]
MPIGKADCTVFSNGKTSLEDGAYRVIFREKTGGRLAAVQLSVIESVFRLDNPI